MLKRWTCWKPNREARYVDERHHGRETRLKNMSGACSPPLWDDGSRYRLDILPNHIGHRHEQMRRPHHNFHGLIRVAEHGDGSHAGHGILSTGESAGFTVGLERRHDLFRHLLEVSYLIKPDGVPNADQGHFLRVASAEDDRHHALRDVLPP